MKPGDLVTYKNGNRYENGIVKSISDKDYVFVVYNCGGDWRHYDEYTAARTEISMLKKGWRNENI